MARKLDLIITGTGRCATRFYTKFINSALPKLWIGHECFFSLGGLDKALQNLKDHWRGLRAECSWAAAPFLNSEPLKDAFAIHLVRHPQACMGSMYHAGWFADEHFLIPFVSQHASIMRHKKQIDRIACYYIEWNEIIERELNGRTAVRFPVENEPRGILDLLCARDILSDYDASALFDNRQYNTLGKHRRTFQIDDFSPDLRGRLLDISGRYGYNWQG